MRRALDAGQIVNIKPASLTATLNSPFVGQAALDLCSQHLEDLILVSDLDMVAAQQYFIEHEDLRPELAAASTLAAAERVKDRLPADTQLVLLICGCNDSAGRCRRLRPAARVVRRWPIEAPIELNLALARRPQQCYAAGVRRHHAADHRRFRSRIQPVQASQHH